MLAWKSFTASKEIPSFKENPGGTNPTLSALFRGQGYLRTQRAPPLLRPVSLRDFEGQGVTHPNEGCVLCFFSAQRGDLGDVAAT